MTSSPYAASIRWLCKNKGTGLSFRKKNFTYSVVSFRNLALSYSATMNWHSGIASVLGYVKGQESDTGFVKRHLQEAYACSPPVS